MPFQSVHQTTKWSNHWSRALDLVMKSTCLLSNGLMYTQDMAEMQSPSVLWPNTWLLHNRDQQNFMWQLYFPLWDNCTFRYGTGHLVFKCLCKRLWDLLQLKGSWLLRWYIKFHLPTYPVAIKVVNFQDSEWEKKWINFSASLK